MIFGYRVVKRPNFHGLNLFLLKDFVIPMEHLGQSCFDAFDEALNLLSSDPDSTRIHPIHTKSPEVTTLNTASESALRAIPERYRSSTELFTVAQSKVGKGRTLFLQIPAWISLHLEDDKGDIFLIKSELPLKNQRWIEVPLEDADRFIHLKLFSDSKVPKLGPSIEREEFFRFANIALAGASGSELSPNLSIELRSEEGL